MARMFAVLVCALLAGWAANAFSQAAYVHDMKGTSTATVGTAQRALKIGDTLESGTTVSTGDKSSAVIKFEDGQVMALSERTSFRIVDYRYNKQRVSQSSAVFSLLQGGMRFITGVIGATNRNNFRLTAGTATIGIRGTDGTVLYDSVTQAVIAAVNAGALEMATPQGNQSIGAGNFSRVSQGQGPTAPQATEGAEAAVRQTLNNLLVLGVPINTPVVVKASAAAAAAQARAAQLAAQAAAQPGNAALQTAAQEAAIAAQTLTATAIQEAQQAYDQAVKEGGAAAPEPASTTLPSDATSATSDPGISTTPAGGAGAGGGGTACGASCN